MSGGHLQSVPEGAQHPDLPRELVSLATSASVQFDYTSARGYMPTHYSLMNRAEAYKQIDPDYGVFLSVLPYAHFRPAIPQYTEISAAVQDAIQSAVLGQMSPQAALDAAATKVDQLLAGQ